MRGIPEYADFQWSREGGENFLLTPCTLRAVLYLKRHCESYEVESMADGFIARPVVIFEERAESVLEKIHAAGLRV
jgi:hypothetical protein